MINRRSFLLSSSLILLNIANANFFSKNVDFKSLKIGYLPISDHLLIIAKELYNSPFTPIKFSSWADLSEALRAKAIDGAFILTPLALRLRTQGVSLKAIFAAHRNGSALVLKKGILETQNAKNLNVANLKNVANGKNKNAENVANIAKSDSLNKNAKNNFKPDISLLKGLRIAIPSRFSTHYLLLANLLEQGGLTPNDIKIVDMSPPEMVFGLLSNSIDGFIVAEPFGFIAELRDIAELFRLSKDIVNNHICCVFALREEVLADSQMDSKILADSGIQTIVNNFVKTAHFIEHNHEDSAILGNKLLGYKPEIIKNLLDCDERVVFKNLKLSKNDIDWNVKNMQDFGIWSNGADKIADSQSDIFSDFVDSTLLDSAFKALDSTNLTQDSTQKLNLNRNPQESRFHTESKAKFHSGIPESKAKSTPRFYAESNAKLTESTTKNPL
ncbi:hypothetical protein CCY99_01690 [Helicobacter sp. 16-1353]|nr:hypothetical protein CCY99_01690 [Helicobacter sp. 16-1353]